VRSGALAERIREVRGLRVMLDVDLAILYGVSTGRLNEQVARNGLRFPADFMFRLTVEEFESLKSQIAISSSRRGGRRRSTPLAFTEHGVAMLSSVLKSPRAIAVSIEIVRTFVRLRRMQAEYSDLRQRLDELESKYDATLKRVFDAIRALTIQESTPRPAIGFRKR